jgi:hypothetical protein
MPIKVDNMAIAIHRFSPIKYSRAKYFLMLSFCDMEASSGIATITSVLVLLQLNVLPSILFQFSNMANQQVMVMVRHRE